MAEWELTPLPIYWPGHATQTTSFLSPSPPPLLANPSSPSSPLPLKYPSQTLDRVPAPISPPLPLLLSFLLQDLALAPLSSPTKPSVFSSSLLHERGRLSFGSRWSRAALAGATLPRSSPFLACRARRLELSLTLPSFLLLGSRAGRLTSDPRKPPPSSPWPPTSFSSLEGTPEHAVVFSFTSDPALAPSPPLGELPGELTFLSLSAGTTAASRWRRRRRIVDLHIDGHV